MNDTIAQITGALPILCMTEAEGKRGGSAKDVFAKKHAKVRKDNPVAAELSDFIDGTIASAKARIATLTDEELRQEMLVHHREGYRKWSPKFIEALRTPGDPQREYHIARSGQAYVDFMTAD